MGWRRSTRETAAAPRRPAVREQPTQVERGAVARAACQLRLVFRDRTRRVAARLEHEGEIVMGALDVSALGERRPERAVRIVPSFHLDVALAQLDEERRTVDFVRQRPGERALGLGEIAAPHREVGELEKRPAVARIERDGLFESGARFVGAARVLVRERQIECRTRCSGSMLSARWYASIAWFEFPVFT